MAKFIGICVGLFVVAIGFIVVTQAQDLAALLDAFRAESLAHKLAWFVVVLIPMALVPSALWLCDSLMRQRKAAAALELRLGGVRDGVKDLVRSQVDAEAAVNRLARTDPEDAISAVQQRLTEAERLAQIQESRNEIGDLQSRVEQIRAQQQGLRERLLPVLEKRRSIEQLFADLDSRESDLDRTLDEIASGEDAVAIDVRLKSLMDFVRRSHERCDEIEHASKTVASLKEDYGQLRERLAPYAAVDDGIARRLRDLADTRDELAGAIEALQQTPQGGLAGRVQAFADHKRQLDDNLSGLEMQFSRLATLRKDADGLSARFDRALDLISTPDASDADTDGRIDELSDFVKATQSRFDDIEHTMVAVGQLKTKLGDLQSRLVPLESKDGGVADLVAQVQDIRDRLAAKVNDLEADENGDLATRVRDFYAAKQDLEQRVATVTEHFSKLAMLRHDISGLFDKLSSAADAN